MNAIIGELEREFFEAGLFFSVLDKLPTEVGICAPDGTVLFLNTAMEEVWRDDVMVECGVPLRDRQKRLRYLLLTCETLRTRRTQREVRRAQEFIVDRWVEEFDLEKIARAANVSKFHLIRRFKADTGRTPYEFYRELKIEKLKERLAEPEVNVAGAFLACGLDYKSQYGRYFKDATGMTPSEYQKKMREERAR